MKVPEDVSVVGYEVTFSLPELGGAADHDTPAYGDGKKGCAASKQYW